MMITNHAVNKVYKFDKAFLLKLLKYLLTSLTIITVLVIFIPLNPEMPYSDIDGSWIFSMNKAVVAHLAIGKEIIFTFGPYASIHTKSYHPETDVLMIFGSLFFGLCYAATLLYLAKDKKNYQLFAVLFYLAGFGFILSRDALFFSYPLLLAVCTTEFVRQSKPYNKRQLWITAILFAALGLLPLIKGSFLLICTTLILAITSYLFYHRYRSLSLLVLISPIVSTLIFWILSGQSIFVLPSFFASLSPIIFGYTEAMASQGDITEVVAYLLATIVIIWIFMTSSNFTVSNRIFLGFCFLFFLFIAFKSAFVRHDGHVNLAASALIFAALIINFISTGTAKIITLLVCLMASSYINTNYVNTSITRVFYNLYNTYANSLNGLYLRFNQGNDLQLKFEHSLTIIRQEYPIPALQGSTDVYPYYQSHLLASANKWNPRPIIQSYSAYTPLLAKINEQHLRGDNAPDNILFAVRTIDERFPTLDDGLSWPALLDNYSIIGMDGSAGYLHLRKKPILQKNSSFQVLHNEIHKIGETVVLPITDAAIYAEINLKPTLEGKLLSILYKPPQLTMRIKLTNGAVEDYRVIANMMESGFFMSPLIKNTSDFAYIGTNELRLLSSNTVESFTIFPSYGGSIFWSANYQLKLKNYINKTAIQNTALDNIIATPNN